MKLIWRIQCDGSFWMFLLQLWWILTKIFCQLIPISSLCLDITTPEITKPILGNHSRFFVNIKLSRHYLHYEMLKSNSWNIILFDFMFFSILNKIRWFQVDLCGQIWILISFPMLCYLKWILEFKNRWKIAKIISWGLLLQFLNTSRMNRTLEAGISVH